MTRYKIEVPGTFASGSAFLDLETAKVPVPSGGYRMPNGETLKNRWSISLAGIARDGKILLLDGDDDETAVRNLVAAVLFGAKEVVYGATREFDEMICKGRFTNARRAHAPAPFFPSVYGADRLPWRNVGVGKSGVYRAADVPSKDVPAFLKSGGEREFELVMIHLLRDVADLILEAGSPDAKCAEWCARVLADDLFAWNAVLSADV